jgi:uncharacterized protein (DUF2237 family)
MDDVFDRRRGGGRLPARNILGGVLLPCSVAPLTGFWRDGCCHAGPEDPALHVVCAEMTEEFLAFSRLVGNDLSTPRPEYGFPGLKPGDRWCLCAARWEEARRAGLAPPILPEATHEAALAVTTREHLLAHAREGDGA